MPKKITTQSFINRAKEIHGDRYDYSKVIYEKAIKKVIITCPVHGDFRQTPANHTIGHGCHECGGNKPLTLDNFKKRAIKKHNNKYDYSQVIFSNVEQKIDIICPIHGIFQQRVMSHLKGFGCDKCGRKNVAKKLSDSKEDFIQKAQIVHGNKYDYSKVKYVNAKSKVIIICPIHGEFYQPPSPHINGVGCPECGTDSRAEKRTKSLKNFVKDAEAIHGDKYDYSKVKYQKSTEKVEIVCPEHGPFWQLPLNHIKSSHSSGCPGCALSGFDQTKPGILYYLAVKTKNNETLYKIGITNLTIKQRFPNEDLKRIRVVKIWNFEDGKDAANKEREILKKYSRFRYNGENVLVGAGNTELFSTDVLNLDYYFLNT